MPTTPINIVLKNMAVQYTGSNSADIAALVTNTSTVDETGGVWIVESPTGSATWTVNTNDWVIYTQNMIVQVASQAAFDFFWQCDVVCTDIAELDETVDELAETVAALEESVTPAVRSMGFAPVPVLILNQTATVAVTLDPAMPDTSYTATAFKFAGVSLTNLNITSVTVVDEDTVNVGVQNVGVASLAGVTLAVTATS